MKKKPLLIISIIIIAIAVFVLLANHFIAKVFENPVLASLPKYDNADCYYSDGFQDYTDYCKYYYTNQDNIIEKIEKNKYFKPVTQTDVDEIKSYFDNFEGRVRYEDYKEMYDFQEGCVDLSDYFYIENKDNCEKYAHYSDQYAAYNVYVFDTQTKTLFFIHSNI